MYRLFHPARTWEARGADISERATILIVDDEAELREVLEEYLNAQGYTALSAGDAVAARALCAKPAIDLAILDIRLPGERQRSSGSE